MSQIINQDFIGVVTIASDGLPRYKKVTIDKLFLQEYKELTAICNNDDRTVLDLQDSFQHFFPKDVFGKYHDFCYPQRYSSSFISGVEYPRMLTFNDYKERITGVGENAVKNFLEKYKKKENELTTDEVRDKGIFNTSPILMTYLTEHPDFAKIYEEIETISSEISRSEREISDRESFVKSLMKSKNIITSQLQLAA